ncbi:phage portal protein [Cereibacter changlensis]|nr:phage portal protein [Cereibacter changlensis]PZX53046.1 HK97 family phage portal protein [Cereibacter changlensis]
MTIGQKIKTAFGFKTEEKAFGLNSPEALALFAGQPTATGMHIGPGSAMRVPAVACAVGLISETVGTLPLKLFNRADKATVRDHPAFRLMHGEANEWTSAEELRTQLTADALLHDAGGFALVVRGLDGRPLELHRLKPGTVALQEDTDGTPFYRVSTSSGSELRPFTDILHVRAFGGVAPITLGREAIALAVAFEAHIGDLFRNGGRPSGIIKSPKILDVESKKKLAASWFSTHSGRNAGGTAVLDEAMEYQALSTTLADAQFAENRLEQIREIARVFRVPPTMLFELTRGTWSNTEEMARQFLSVTLKPWLTSWSWAYARCLLTPAERAQFYVEFVTDDLLTTSHAARATAYGQYRGMGVMTANEVRAGLNLPPRPEGDDLANPYTSTGTPEAANDAESEAA